MANKLRVFISSTMDNLQNERRAVVRRLQEFGFEPVFAESMTPGGSTSWQAIVNDMQECHIFLLILGDTYGWVPGTGPGAGQNKSVTHMEFDFARTLGLPIIPFLKNLVPGTKRDKQRDSFRKEVSDWGGGYFRQVFDYADELGEMAAQALVGMLTESLRKDLVRQRDKAITTAYPITPLAAKEPESSSDRWVLLAGAGTSIAAGYPTALALMAAMGQKLWPGTVMQGNLGRHSFSELAAFYERRLGRESLEAVVRELLDTPQQVTPTSAHREAVKKFKTIVTTNLDTLFEMACQGQGIAYQVITPLTDHASTQSGVVSIYKLSGSIEQPSSVLLTLADLDRAISNSFLFGDLQTILKGCRVAVVGHSLRDEHVQKLLMDRADAADGMYVNPYLDALDDITLEKFRLKGIKQTADEFLQRFHPTYYESGAVLSWLP